MSIEPTPEMLSVAKRVVWFMSPEEALARPILLLAHVMTRGLLEDVVAVRRFVGPEAFRQVLDAAPPGLFDARSWAYWNLMYDRWPPPPLPERRMEL
ncbi:MAG: hypothetical protein HY319_30560 [Armatimonadetes bacterium]|nr:hypothetical protein [Armatimonadota bacterium]